MAKNYFHPHGRIKHLGDAGREIRISTDDQGADREAGNLVRQIFTQPGDIDTSIPGYLSTTVDPLPTKHETAAGQELCESLTETQTRHPGTPP